MNKILLWGKNEERINGEIIAQYDTTEGIDLVMSTGVLIRLKRDSHEWIETTTVIYAKFI